MTAHGHAASSKVTPVAPSMLREETLRFLEKHCVQRLRISEAMFESWPEGLPLIYVFQDTIPVHRFLPLDPVMRPSLARVDRPTSVRPTGFLLSSGQVDYYSIDPRTHKIYRVKQSNRSAAQYEAGIPYLFQTFDELFPKGPAVQPAS